jgi:hypothetical protein
MDQTSRAGRQLARVEQDVRLLEEARRVCGLSVHEHGLIIDSASGSVFVPWSEVRSVSSFRTYFTVFTRGDMVTMPEPKRLPEGERIGDLIAARAGLAPVEFPDQRDASVGLRAFMKRDDADALCAAGHLSRRR